MKSSGSLVALLAEGVDRNRSSRSLSVSLCSSPSSRRAWIEICCARPSTGFCIVALLAEGVDRNTATLAANPYVLASPSSRRAWIEIVSGCVP